VEEQRSTIVPAERQHASDDDFMIAAVVERVGRAFERRHPAPQERDAIRAPKPRKTVPFLYPAPREAVGQLAFVFRKYGYTEILRFNP
jgi:hypothetical protein